MNVFLAFLDLLLSAGFLDPSRIISVGQLLDSRPLPRQIRRFGKRIYLSVDRVDLRCILFSLHLRGSRVQVPHNGCQLLLERSHLRIVGPLLGVVALDHVVDSGEFSKRIRLVPNQISLPVQSAIQMLLCELFGRSFSALFGTIRLQPERHQRPKGTT